MKQELLIRSNAQLDSFEHYNCPKFDNRKWSTNSRIWIIMSNLLFFKTIWFAIDTLITSSCIKRLLTTFTGICNQFVEILKIHEKIINCLLQDSTFVFLPNRVFNSLFKLLKSVAMLHFSIKASLIWFQHIVQEQKVCWST